MPADSAGSTIVDGAIGASTLAGLDSVHAGGPVLALAWTEGGRGPEFVPLPPDGLRLGRGTELFGEPVTDGRMSRRHAEIVRDRRQDRWVLRDLGSSNGTYVQGKRIESAAVLLPGDVVRLGGTFFVFVELAGDPTGPEPPPALGLVGESEGMLAVRRTIARVAPHDSSVLINGETGTGKEVVARAIHAASGRSGDFIAINCGAVSGGVLESELFGHVKGAFTGAQQARKGLFRAADGGTLFLDELGEMPSELQVKLLRVLESNVVRPVGGTKEEKVDVRVLAATNRDLVADVRAKRFRSDLFARLHQWPIQLPPLRERREDIPLVSRALLQRKGCTAPLAPDLVETLMLHPWPLNVRGLANVLSVALIGAEPNESLDVTPEVTRLLEAESALLRPASDRAISAVLSSGPVTLPDPMDLGATRPMIKQVAVLPEPDVLAAALREKKGSVAATARALGCSRQQLYRLIESLGWDLDDYREG